MAAWSHGLLALALLLVLSACAAPREPAPSPRYVLGEPVRLGGLWAYPREEFSRAERGVAEVLAVPAPRLSSSGEILRARDLVAAHPTLQLPSVLVVTNLETGRSLRVRAIERGPDRAGRAVAVSPRAAELLGARGPFQVRVEVDAEASRAAIAGLPGLPEGPRLAAAPVGRVEREALAPPEGARGTAGPVRPLPTADVAPASAAAPRAEALPEAVTAGQPQPGRLMLEASTFFRRDLAQRQSALLPGGRAVPAGLPGRQQPWRAVAGPFATVAEADAALAAAMRAGLAELRLVVE